MSRVSAYVRSKLLEALPGEAATQAISRLETTSFPLAKPGSRLEARIRLGIVKLVCDPWHSTRAEPTPIEKFDDALRLANADWRDLLVRAGLEHEDWPQVLTAAGYEVPDSEDL